MDKKEATPAPAETRPGHQMDDNIDDLGRKGDREKLEQPVDPKKKAAQSRPR